MDTFWVNNKKKFRFGLCVLMVLGAAFCLWRIAVLSGSLSSQSADERWRGESEGTFAQISCFVPVDEALNLRQIDGFRAALSEELKKAALDEGGDEPLWQDAYSAVGRLHVSSEKANVEASVIAVGGDFFAFHPLYLLSGDYLHADDLMKDRVLLDEELAWALFGGMELQGMAVRIEGRPFLVAGVIEREKDKASQAAYTAGQGLYMNCESFMALTEKENAITAYELVMPEPVENFAVNIAREKFPIGRGEVLQNTGRFSCGRLFGILRDMDRRAMQGMGMIYPYWENAARMTENRCARLLLTAVLLLIVPAVSLIVRLWQLIARGKEAFEERLFPRVRDGVEEAFRRPARRHWERKHRE